MEPEQIKQLATDLNNVADASYQSGYSKGYEKGKLNKRKVEKMSNTKKTKLAPCPFCGGEADTNKIDTKPSNRYYLSCMTVSCEAEGPERHSLNEAIKAWNKRVQCQ